MRNKVGLQTRYDALSPVGIYSTVDRVWTGSVREDRVEEASAGFYYEYTTYLLLPVAAAWRADRRRQRYPLSSGRAAYGEIHAGA